MGSSNFLQWNPNAANQEADSQYAADTLRSGGAGNPSIFPSATANKLFYQLSTMVAALAQAMANKGYTLSDANLTTLAGVLANLMTQADMSAYQRALGFTPVQQGGGASQAANKVYLGWDGGAPRIQIDSSDQGRIAMLNQFGASLGASRSNGYQLLPSGLILQWGWATIPGNGSTLSFPTAFPHAVFMITSSDDHSGGSASARVTSCSIVNTAQFNAFAFDPPSGTIQISNLQWIALGY